MHTYKKKIVKDIKKNIIFNLTWSRRVLLDSNIKFAFVRACDQLFLLAVYSISDLKYAKWAQVD